MTLMTSWISRGETDPPPTRLQGSIYCREGCCGPEYLGGIRMSKDWNRKNFKRVLFISLLSERTTPVGDFILVISLEAVA